MADRVYLVKLEYQVSAETSQKALDIATHKPLCQAAASAVAAFDESTDHLAMLDHADRLRNALHQDHPEVLRTDVRRPGEVGDW